jgi:hypothetical protein
MKIPLPIPFLAAALLAGSSAHGYQLAASSFGGGGNAASPTYVMAGSFDPGGARPVGSPSSIVCPGPLVCHYRPVVAGTPRAHLLQKTPGVFTLMAVPDVPGWSWTSTTNFAEWTPVPGGDANPAIVPIDGTRRFFRLENPDLP